MLFSVNKQKLPSDYVVSIFFLLNKEPSNPLDERRSPKAQKLNAPR